MARMIGRGSGNKSPRAGVIGSALKPPTLHIPVSRRDYSKPEIGAENPLVGMGTNKQPNPSFGQTGLTGES